MQTRLIKFALQIVLLLVLLSGIKIFFCHEMLPFLVHCFFIEYPLYAGQFVANYIMISTYACSISIIF